MPGGKTPSHYQYIIHLINGLDCFYRITKPTVTKFELNDIPHDFMSDPDSVSMINEQIHRITAIQDVEAGLNDSYSNFCDTLKECMTSDLPHHTVVHTADVNNKKRRTNKVWWTDELTTLWKVEINVTRKDSGGKPNL